MMTDPVADMLTRIRNAIGAKHDRVNVPLSKLKVNIAKVLQKEGYIASFSVVEDGHGHIVLMLKYDRDHTNAILGLKRTSRPGRRVYVGRNDAPRVLNGMGISIISTSLGLLTDRDARKQHVGGEVLCEVW